MLYKFEDHFNFEEEYSPELYEVVLSEQLDEADKKFFMTNTDPGRIKRAKTEIRHTPPRVTDIGDGYERLEYNFKANPSTEFKRHWGYVDAKGNNVKEVFCDCKDFFYRLYAPMVKKGLATWDLPPKFKNRLTKRPNRAWTNTTNPEGKLFVCKHLYALISEYVDDTVQAKPIKIKDDNKEKQQKVASKDKRQQMIDKQKQDKQKRDMEAQKRKEKFQTPKGNVGKTDQKISADVDTLTNNGGE